jgi:hypothetical protein
MTASGHSRLIQTNLGLRLYSLAHEMTSIAARTRGKRICARLSAPEIRSSPSQSREIKKSDGRSDTHHKIGSRFRNRRLRVMPFRQEEIQLQVQRSFEEAFVGMAIDLSWKSYAS